jgi:hypothetical protein
MPILDPESFKHHVDYFNTMEPEDIVNMVPNSRSWQWMKDNIPFFTCPDQNVEQIYYFRWWTYRKHLVETPVGIILTEFIVPMKHAGSFNSISCALGHHIAEGRWLNDTKILDDYIKFWFRSNNGKPEAKFHNFSSWVAAATWNRFLVTGDHHQILDLFDDLQADYQRWEQERQLPNGLFWQFDVRDGMEESISGSRHDKNARPTINSYMYGNATAIAAIAKHAGNTDVDKTFSTKAARIKELLQKSLWDDDAKFFKAQTGAGMATRGTPPSAQPDAEHTSIILCESREELGYIPWYFNLPDPGREAAWSQLADAKGFSAPFGITTAERRAPKFRSHGVGNCEWDGSVWPFATSQTLTALANVLRNYPNPPITQQDYFNALLTYVKSHRWEGDKPYIGEYLDENTGAWLKGNNPRSRYYNHSTFCDLVISQLVGIVPREDRKIELSPLLPANTWDWFCLQNVPYHSEMLTVVWDRDGKKFNQQPGLTLYLNDKPVAHSPDLNRLITDDLLRELN